MMTTRQQQQRRDHSTILHALNEIRGPVGRRIIPAGVGTAAPGKAELRVRSHYRSLGLSRWCISLLVLNVGTTFSDTATSPPLRGFRPVRASRFLTANTPKSRSSTRSP